MATVREEHKLGAGRWDGRSPAFALPTPHVPTMVCRLALPPFAIRDDSLCKQRCTEWGCEQTAAESMRPVALSRHVCAPSLPRLLEIIPGQQGACW